MKFNKLFVGFFVAVFVFGSLGVSYAVHNGVRFRGRTYDLEFVTVTLTDNESVDYAQINYLVSTDKKSLDVSIDNCYPGYSVSVLYTIQNSGEYPIAINNIYVSNPSPDALEVNLQYFEPFLLEPQQSFQRTEQVTILPDAEQNHVYSFKIKINVDREPNGLGSIGYWKHQFSSWLYGKGKPHVSDVVLEDWLDEISSESEIFDFVGETEDKFFEAYSILDPSKPWTHADHLRCQLLALWLNYVSGRTVGYKMDGMSEIQIIINAEQTILLNENGKMSYWQNMCECFNKLSFQ